MTTTTELDSEGGLSLSPQRTAARSVLAALRHRLPRQSHIKESDLRCVLRSRRKSPFAFDEPRTVPAVETNCYVYYFEVFVHGLKGELPPATQERGECLWRPMDEVEDCPAEATSLSKVVDRFRCATSALYFTSRQVGARRAGIRRRGDAAATDAATPRRRTTRNVRAPPPREAAPPDHDTFQRRTIRAALERPAPPGPRRGRGVFAPRAQGRKRGPVWRVGVV